MTTEKDAEAFAETMARVFSEVVDRWAEEKRAALVSRLVDLATSGDARAGEVAREIRAMDKDRPAGTVCIGYEVKDGAIETVVDVAATPSGAPVGNSAHPFAGNLRIRFQPVH